MSFLAQASRAVLRKLARSPFFTLMTIGTLALGIGANIAVFSVVNGVLLEPLPYDDPERLVGLWHEAPGLNAPQIEQSPATYFTYREDAKSFVDVGLWDNGQVAITGFDEPEQVRALFFSEATLHLLGTKPALGRLFQRDDDQPDGAKTVILSYDYWQGKLAGDEAVLGQPLTIDGEAWEIIGVLPQGFEFLNFQPEVYMPLQLDRSEAIMGNFSFQGIARLRDGVTLEQANADIARLIPIAVEKFPGGLSLSMLEEARFGPKVQPLELDAIGTVGPSLWILFGTVGIVLLIACANVANLFLIRAEGRQQEVAVRTALGASRGDIRREFLVESLVLAILGAVGGLVLAALGLRLLIHLAPSSLPRLSMIEIDGMVLLFALGMTALTGIVLGLVPSFHLAKLHLVSALKEGSRGASDGRQRHRTRHALVVSQVALALVLMTGAGLMIRSFQALRQVEPGFERPEEVLTFRLSIPSAELEDDEEVALAHEELLRRLGELPGVESIAASTSFTMEGWNSNDAFYVEEFPTPEGQLPPIRRFKWVAPGYFETMENELVAGRTLTWDDIHARRPVAIVTENLAREFWNDPREALGKRVHESVLPGGETTWREIVGVVGDVHDDGAGVEAVKTVFWPMVADNMWGDGLHVRRSLAYVIRGPRVGTPGFLDEVRDTVWGFNGNLPLARVRTLDEVVERSMARTSFTLVMLGIAALVALLLGVVGIYGVTSYAASQRTREIGVRMALGADRSDVRWLILGRAIALGAVGVTIGLAASFALTRLMSSLLFGVEAMDPPTLGLVTVVLLCVALLASYLPASRASRTDPMVALRCE